MPLLFSYGTLQEEHVQISTFGRRLQGYRDELSGYETALIPIADPKLAAATGRTHHANLVFNGRPDSRVSGTVFVVTDRELESADEYEDRAAYKRIAVTLISGKPAWVYVSSRPSSNFGCVRCWPPTPNAAWEARGSLRRVADLVDESHFSVGIMACPDCAQRFVSVFTETIDWAHGD